MQKTIEKNVALGKENEALEAALKQLTGKLSNSEKVRDEFEAKYKECLKTYEAANR